MIDPESFKGKMYLIAADKLLIGALIAGAFVMYESSKRTEVFNHDFELAKVQQVGEQAKLLHELLPKIIDDKANPSIRTLALSTAVQNANLDTASTLRFVDLLLKERVDSHLIAYLCERKAATSLETVCDIAHQLSSEWHAATGDATGSTMSIHHDGRKATTLQNENYQMIARHLFWQKVLIDSIADDNLDVMQSQILSERLDDICFLLRSDSLDIATRIGSHSSDEIRFIGKLLHLLNKRTSNELPAQFAKELMVSIDSPARTRRAQRFLGVLINEYFDYEGKTLPTRLKQRKPATWIGVVLATILTTKCTPEYDLPGDVKAAHFSDLMEMRRGAGEMLLGMNLENDKVVEGLLMSYIEKYCECAALIDPAVDRGYFRYWHGHYGGHPVELAAIVLVKSGAPPEKIASIFKQLSKSTAESLGLAEFQDPDVIRRLSSK